MDESAKLQAIEAYRQHSESLPELLGIQLSMTRVKCALLSLKVLKAGAYGMPAPEELMTDVYVNY